MGLGSAVSVSVEEILMSFEAAAHLGAKRQGTAEITLQRRVFDLRLSSKSDDAVHRAAGYHLEIGISRVDWDGPQTYPKVWYWRVMAV